MKYIRIFLILLLMCNSLWLFRWEKGPETEFSEMKYDRVAKQSWIVFYDTSSGRQEKPLFTDVQINNIKNAIPDKHKTNRLIQLEKTISKYAFEVNEKQKIIDQNQEVMNVFYENAKKLRHKQDFETHVWFPPDIEGACWVINNEFFTKGFTKEQLAEVKLWCDANEEIQETKMQLEKYQQELDMYEREIAESMLTEEAWKKRNQITNVSIGTLAVSVLLVILSFIRFKKTEK